MLVRVALVRTQQMGELGGRLGALPHLQSRDPVLPASRINGGCLVSNRRWFAVARLLPPDQRRLVE